MRVTVYNGANRARTLDNAEENWAILGLARLWRGQALAFEDDGLVGVLVGHWEQEKKLTPRQWEKAVSTAKRYAKQLGAAPSPKQGELL